MRRTQPMIPTLLLLSLGSCANNDGGGPLGIVAFSTKQHLAEAEPLFGNEEDKCLSRPAFLISLVSSVPETDPKPHCVGLRTQVHTYLTGQPPTGQQEIVQPPAAIDKNNPPAAPIDKNKSPGQTPVAQSPAAITKEKRNDFIDAMTSASDRKCQRYIAFLKTYDGNVNNTFGLAALLTAAVVPVAGPAAGALGAASAFSSGTRTTLNSNNFANQSIQVITTAFQKARQARLDEIQNLKQCPIAQYSVLKAIGDVYNYHGTCSLTAGLAETALAVQRSNTPDLDAMNTMIATYTALQKQAAAFVAAFSTKQQSGGADAPPAAAPAAGAPAAPAPAAPAPAAAVAAAAPAVAAPAVAAASTPIATASGQVGATHALACPFTLTSSTDTAGKPQQGNAPAVAGAK